MKDVTCIMFKCINCIVSDFVVIEILPHEFENGKYKGKRPICENCNSRMLTIKEAYEEGLEM